MFSLESSEVCLLFSTEDSMLDFGDFAHEIDPKGTVHKERLQN